MVEWLATLHAVRVCWALGDSCVRSGRFKRARVRVACGSSSCKRRCVLTHPLVCSPLVHTVIESFDDMTLKEDLLRGIYSYGFEKPSAIQQRAIKPLMLMRDTIAQAQSGTGKTATFSIGAPAAPAAGAVAARRRW